MTEELFSMSTEEYLRRQKQEIAGIYSFQTASAGDLVSTPLEPPRFVISGLLTQGVHILGGPPKTGKSWLVLWMAIQVANGDLIWNYETVKGTVLYLALEDNYSRLQGRLLDITSEGAPDNLILGINARTIGDGLESQVDTFVSEHPDTRLIIIDTLQRVRPVTVDTRKSAYSSDYQDMGVIKQLADKHRIAILLVHHLRKQSDSDPLNMLSGSTGLSGAVDSTFILMRDSRTENAATLFCTGRDITSQEINLVFSEDAHRWLLRDENYGIVQLLDPTVGMVADYFDTYPEELPYEGSACELAERVSGHYHTNIFPAVMSKQILGGAKQLLARGYEFHYTRNHAGRKLIINRCEAREA